LKHKPRLAWETQEEADNPTSFHYRLTNYGPARVGIGGFTTTERLGPGSAFKYTRPDGTVVDCELGGVLTYWTDYEEKQYGAWFDARLAKRPSDSAPMVTALRQLDPNWKPLPFNRYSSWNYQATYEPNW
jgi:hypothetical protein